MISQLTDIFLPRHHRHPLALIKTDQQRKKIGEKTFHFDNLGKKCKLGFVDITNESTIKNSKIVYDDLSTAIHLDLIGFNYLGKGDLSKAVFDLYSNAKIEKLNMIYQNEPYLMNKKVDGDLITKVNINSLSFIFEQNDLKINKIFKASNL